MSEKTKKPFKYPGRLRRFYNGVYNAFWDWVYKRNGVAVLLWVIVILAVLLAASWMRD